MTLLRQIKVLGVPFYFGQTRPGVKETPRVLRSHGLFDRLHRIAPTIDLGDLDFDLCQGPSTDGLIKNERASSLGNELISQCIETEDLSDTFLLSIGGDHGLALGTIHGLLQKNPHTVVVWADAHGDINTPETSPSGNFHGMPLAFLLGQAKNPASFAWLKQTLSPLKLILMGPRDLDPGERNIIKELSIQYYSSFEINYFGAERLLKAAIQKADPLSVCPIHLSFDVDVFDSEDVYSTGTRVEEGPRFEEVFNIGRVLAKTGRLKSMDMVEINPELGDENEMLDTLHLALEFLDSTMGEVFQKQAKPLPFYPHFLDHSGPT